MNKKKLLYMATLTVFALAFISLPASEAHILVIGDSQSDIPQSYTDTVNIASLLKSKGYQVYEVYRKNATTKNIVKGMYGADAIIYSGHGGFESGHYDLNGGSATPPFALLGSDGFIWGFGDKMFENGKLFTAPIKPSIPVFLLQACFSTGWVDDKEVANPVSTIYNFARMFTGVGANYYATSWTGAQIVKDFINGAQTFQEANNMNYEKIVKANPYNGTTVWKNLQGYAAFVGNWLGTFPKAYQTTKFNNTAAEAWYNSDRSQSPYSSDLTVQNIIAPLNGFKGYKISVPNTISNLAKVGSAAFSVNYYLKTNYTSPNIYLGQRFYTSLGALSSKQLYTSLRIPTNIASGSYYILVYVDSGKNNSETNENNNFKISSNKVNIRTAYKDLIVTNITANLNGISGNTFYISNTVKNTGTLPTSNFWVHYYIKGKGESGRGTYIGEKYFTGLSAGASKNQELTLKTSSSVVASKYYIAAYVDAHKTVQESSENNNYKMGTIKSV